MRQKYRVKILVSVEKNRCVLYTVQCRKIRKNGRFARIKQTARFLEI